MALVPPPPGWAPGWVNPAWDDPMLVPPPPPPGFDLGLDAVGVGAPPFVIEPPDERPEPLLPPPPPPGEPWDAEDIQFEDENGAGVALVPPLVPDEATGRPGAPPLEPDEPLVDDGAAGAPPEIEVTEEEAAADAEAERWASVQALADLDPESWARVNAEHQLKQEAERATRERMIAVKEQEQLEASIAARDKARAAATAELETVKGEATKLADGSPFAQWWSTRSTAQKAAGYLSAIIGGFLSSRTGGRNTALDLFMKVADDEANAKWTSLRERRGLASDAMASADNELQTRMALTLASREQAIRMMEAELAQLDPRGTQHLRVAGAVREARGQQAAALEKFGADSEKRNLEVFKANSDRMKAEADMMRARAEAAKKAGGGAGGGAGKEKHPPEYFAQRYGITDPKDLPPVPMTEREFDKFRQVRRDLRTGDLAEAADERAALDTKTKADREAAKLVINDPFTGQPLGPVTNGVDPAKVQEALTAGTTVIKTFDKLRRLANKANGAADWRKSPEWQEIQATTSFLTAQISKALELGSMDAGLQDVADKMKGAVDPTSFIYNAERGLAMGRSNFEGRARDILRGAGIDAAKWSIPDMGSLPKPRKDEVGSRLTAEPTYRNKIAGANRVQQERGEVGVLSVDISGAEPKVSFGPDDSGEYDKAALDIAEAAITRGDEDADVQASNLVEAAGGSQNPRMRRNAALRLRALLVAKNPAALKAMSAAGRSKAAAALANLPGKERKQAFADLFDTDDGDD